MLKCYYMIVKAFTLLAFVALGILVCIGAEDLVSYSFSHTVLLKFYYVWETWDMYNRLNVLKELS